MKPLNPALFVPLEGAINASTYRKFVHCPYSTGLPDTASEAMLAGKTVHQQISRFFTGSPSEPPESFLRWVEEQLRHTQNRSVLVEREVSWLMEVPGMKLRFPVRGTPDLVLQGPDGLTILDWKTSLSGRKPGRPWAQGVIYRLMLEQAQGEPVHCRRVYLSLRDDRYTILELERDPVYEREVILGLYGAWLALSSGAGGLALAHPSKCRSCISRDYCQLKKEEEDAGGLCSG